MINNNRLNNIIKKIVASHPESEVERLFLHWLKTTPFNRHVFAVGGYVRDQVINKVSKDLDIVVDKKGGAKKFTYYIHQQFRKETSNPYELGAGYPIWHIVFKEDIKFNNDIFKVKGAELDVADTQKESFPDETTRQRVTEFGDIKEDAIRRDFSVNSLYKDLSNNEFKDVTGISKKDIESGILRGNPGVSLDKIFNDDPLRMIRLCVFYARYRWKIPLSVLKIVKKNARRINIVSSERIMTELKKAMKIGKLHLVIKLFKITGLLKYILPEINDMIGVEHDTARGVHLEGDVFRHTLEVLKNAPPTVEGQLAALLHDVGKPKTQKFVEDKIMYLGHEEVGEEMAEAIAKRLKFDSKVVKRVKKIVRNHMRPHAINRNKGGVKSLRKLIRKVGDELVDAVLDMAEADALGTLPPYNYIPELRKQIEEVRKIPVKKEPILSGREIMDILNLKPGKIIGEVKNYLQELEDEYVSQNKTLTKKEAEEEIIKEFKNVI